MRDEFNLDALAVHGLAEQDPDARIVNPARRKIERRINRLRNRLGTLRNRVADLLRGEPSDTATASAGKLKNEIATPSARRSSSGAGNCPHTSRSPNSARTSGSTRCPPASGCSSTSSA